MRWHDRAARRAGTALGTADGCGRITIGRGCRICGHWAIGIGAPGQASIVNWYGRVRRARGRSNLGEQVGDRLIAGGALSRAQYVSDRAARAGRNIDRPGTARPGHQRQQIFRRNAMGSRRCTRIRTRR